MAAHVDGPKGLLSIPVAAHIQDILSQHVLDAVEVIDESTVEKIHAKLPQNDVVAAVRSSDTTVPGSGTHVLRGIGRRRTWIKAARPDLLGIRHALSDPELRIRLGEPKPPSHTRIDRVRVNGGFFSGEDIPLSPDLTCLLGGTGTGKSLVLELIRFVLDMQTDGEAFEHIREEVDLRLEGALGRDSTVELDITTDDGNELTIRRTYDPEEPPSPEVVAGRSREIPRINAFSQGEVIEFARTRFGRMDLVDSAIDLSDLKRTESEILRNVEEANRNLASLRADSRTMHRSLQELDDVVRRSDELAGLFDESIADEQARWSKERARFSNLVSIIPSEDDHTIQVKASFNHPAANESNQDLYGKVGQALARYREKIEDANKSAAAARSAVRSALQSVENEWKSRHRDFSERVSILLERAGSEDADLQALRTRLEQLQERRTNLEDQKTRLEDEVEPELKRLDAHRTALVDQLVSTRNKRRERRQRQVESLNRLMTGSVKLKIEREAGDDEFFEVLRDLARGSRLRKEQLKTIANEAAPSRLVESFLEDDAASVAEAVGLPEERVQVLFDHIVERNDDVHFIGLATLDLPDALAVKFRKPEGGRYVDIERLAHGQKCTAILIVAMADGSDPLIIDQPEDALHAPWIEEHLVDRLRDLRGQRQYLFATRSPGLVVSADAEMLITLTSSKDRGKVEAKGSLERHDLNEKALYHLEGGPDPFRRRATKLRQSLANA